MNCVDDCKYREMLDDANADLQELKAENAKLKNNNNYLHEMLSESRQANEHLHAELKRHKSILRTRPNAMIALYDENAKLRELVQRTWDAFHNATAREFVKVKNELRELGIEVDG